MNAKQINYLPWIAVGVLGYMLFVQQPTAKPEPDKPVAPSVEKVTSSVLPSIKLGYSRAFTEAAKLVESKEIKTDRELLEIVSAATKTAREQSVKPFDAAFNLALPRNDDGTFADKESEVASVLRRIAKSW